MSLTHITGTKNKPRMWLEGELAIDAKAAEVRARFATPGLDGVYLQKREEAQRYLEAISLGVEPDLALYPYLTMEIGSTAPTAQALAELWLYMNQQFQIAGSFIEAIRTGAKSQVRAAKSNADITAIVAAAVAQLDEIGPKPPPRPNKPNSFIQPVN
jgi:hypothetical protein